MSRKCYPLTEAKVKKAKPGCLFDGMGLFVETFENGSKLWRFRYNFQGRTHKVSLGRYPQVSLAKARKLRDEYRASLAQGINPKVGENEEVRISTFKVVAVSWFEGWSKSVTPAYSKHVLSRLEHDVFPHIGHIPVKELTAVKVLATLRKLERKGVTVAVQRTNLIIGQILKYAVATGLVAYDCRGGLARVIKVPEAKHYPTLGLNEIPELVRCIDSGEVVIGPATRIALKLLLLTMVRSREVMGASWSEVDLEQRLWTIPPHRMKARRVHHIPLSEQAIALLTQAKEFSNGSVWVFPSSKRAGNHMNFETPTEALDRLGYGRRLTSHGIRSLCAGLLISRGHSIDLVDAALAHEQSRVRRAYFRHPDLSSRKAMFDDLGTVLEASGLTLGSG